MLKAAELPALVLALVSLSLLLCGILSTIQFELSAAAEAALMMPPALTIAAVGLGIAGLVASLALWLLTPHLAAYFGRRFKRAAATAAVPSAATPIFSPPRFGVGAPMTKGGGIGRRKFHRGNASANCSSLFINAPPQIDADTTESLMRSIRGIPYLIQAIQYSLETSLLLSEMGGAQTSVIHTAPGCTSVLDCCGGDTDAERQLRQSGDDSTRLACGSSPPPPVPPPPPLVLPPRHPSGPEEQWEKTSGDGDAHHRHQFYWINQQLRLSMLSPHHRANSALAVFPYSESQPPTTGSLDEPSLLSSPHDEERSVMHCSCGTEHHSSTERFSDIDGGAETSYHHMDELDHREIEITAHHHGSYQHRSTRPVLVHQSRISVPSSKGGERKKNGGGASRREIRCIGMSQAFLSRFNNSFRT